MSIKKKFSYQNDVPIRNLKDSVLSDGSLDNGIAYENDKGPITVNQLTEIPVEDLMLSDSKELS